MSKAIVVAMCLGAWSLVSAGQGGRVVQLGDLTVAADRLPRDCRLKTGAEPGPLRLNGKTANPWIGRDRASMAAMRASIQESPRVPDGPPLGTAEARQFFLRWADGVEEAYEAVYVGLGAREVRVRALRFSTPEAGADLQLRRDPRGRTSTRVVLGSIVAVVQGDGESHQCFEAIRDHVQSLAK
jgi:hypothetical protein